MRKYFPDEYDFFPRTWVLPQQYEELKSFKQHSKINKTHAVFIAKPEASC